MVHVTLVIEPVIVGNKKGRREKSSEIPLNFTDLGAAIKVAGNAIFEKVKPWGNKAKNTDGTEAALIDPEVYFDLAFSCNQDPENILDAIRNEWRRQGGNRLDMKLLDCFDMQTVLVAYMIHNRGNHNTIIKEAGQFLKEARDLEQKEANEGEFPYGQLEIAMIVIRNIVPKVPGQDTSQYSNWHWKETEKRKALNLKCASEDMK